MNAPVQFFQNAQAYFAMVVSYMRKMLMKSSPGVDFMNILHVYLTAVVK
jgi:hypothetical protein